MKKRILAILMIVLICFSNVYAEEIPGQATFLVKAYKRAPAKPGAANTPHADVAPTLKVYDSISTRLGLKTQISEQINLTPVKLNNFLDEFFTTGINVAMLSISGVTGYGKTTGNNKEIAAIPDAFASERMSSHSNTVTIKATPMKVTEVVNGKVTKVADFKDAPAFTSDTTLESLGVKIYIKTSKFSVLGSKVALVQKEHPENKNIVEYNGINTRKVWGGTLNRDLLDTPYIEYKLISEKVDASKSTPASVKLTVTNSTCREEAILLPGEGFLGSDKRTYQWIKNPSNLEWTIENEIWIEGSRALFDQIPAGTYRMAFKIEVATN